MAEADARVAIVGAGPTGLTLALLLDRAGIRSTVVEANGGPQLHPAACILDTRTMEIFREIGIADQVLERCQDVRERARITWVTTLAGRELGHLSALPDDIDRLLSLSPVHTTVYPQNRLEPLMWQAASDSPLIDLRPANRCVGIEATPSAATMRVAGPDGVESQIEAAYVVGCDGSASAVRRLLGIGMLGRTLQHMIGIYFTADLGTLVDHRRSILYWTLNPDAFGVLIGHWLPHEWVLFVPYFPPQQTPAEFAPAQCANIVEAALGMRPADLRVELVQPWVLAARLAERYRADRIFLAGDAAHGFPPTGGLGLNTGVQDAHNLAWKLAAVLNGSAAPQLLDTYETERRPVAKTNLEHSVRNFEHMNDLYEPARLDLRQTRRLAAIQNARLFRILPERVRKWLVRASLRTLLQRLSIFAADNVRGEAARREFVRRIPGQAHHYRFLGLDLGFTYSKGAFVSEPTPKPEPADPIADYRPTTWPSSRLPHLWVQRGGVRQSVHDLLSPTLFTLLVHVPGAPRWHAALVELGQRRKLIECLAIGADGDAFDIDSRWHKLSEVGQTGAVLVRPDGHVAWRVRELPREPGPALADVLNRIGFPEKPGAFARR